MAKFETLVDIFDLSIKTYPDRELFGTKTNGQWRWITYLEFGRTVDRFRAGLAELGLTKGDKLAIVANNRVEWAVAAYACFGLGIIYVPMYEAQKSTEWEYIMNDCGAKAVIGATDAICTKLHAMKGRLTNLAHVISLEASKSEDGGVLSYAELCGTRQKVPFIRPTSDDIACVIYTSGTTGQPKGVVLSNGNISSNVNAVHEVFPMSASDRSLSFLPWAHAFGQTVELHTLFSLGAAMALAESVEKIVDNLAETRPTLLISVPRIFNKIYQGVQKQISSRPDAIQKMVKIALATRRKQRDGQEVSLSEGLVTALTDKVVFAKVRARFGGRLRYAFSGGAAISTEVAEFIDGLGITVYEGYGLSETSPIATGNWPGSRRIGSVGRPVPGCRVEVTDEGELIVYGPNVMKGYFNKPEETAQVMTKDGGFRTGDTGRIEDGFVYITGRIKEQYKLENGKYVAPSPLEEEIKLSPYVANVMVYGDNRAYNVALIVPNFDNLRAWGTDHGLSSASNDVLLADPKVRTLFEEEMKTYGGKFKGFESVRDFALIGEDFTTENEMLTPTLKLKRRRVLEVHGGVLDLLYKKQKKTETEIRA